MRILGVLKKPRFVGQVFNLNNTSAIFSDNTGRHGVSTTAVSLGSDIEPNALMIGRWPSHQPIWDFVGTIRDFVVTKV